MSLLGDIKKFVKNSVDGVTQFIAVIQTDHAYIHSGLGFTAIIDLGSISAATRIAFKTPTVASGKFIHWRPLGIQSSADYCKIVMTEADTYSAGAAVTPINRNRLSSDTSNMQDVKKTVTSTPAGTVVQQIGIGVSGNPVSRAGGGVAADQEIVLKQNTDYVITITPDSATTVTLELFWYEELIGIS